MGVIILPPCISINTDTLNAPILNITLVDKNDIIYPSMDPSIFEIKYPNSDIKGKITQF